MIKISGTYAEGSQKLEYVCRVLTYKGNYYSCVNHPLTIEHGDVLMMLGKGTWFALYQTPEKRVKTLEYLETTPNL